LNFSLSVKYYGFRSIPPATLSCDWLLCIRNRCHVLYQMKLINEPLRDVDWINLAHEVVQLRAVLNKAEKFRNP